VTLVADAADARPTAADAARSAAPAPVSSLPMPSSGWRGWIGPAVVTLVAALLRFVNLGQPHAVVFDETYYVKDGLALWRYGYERGAVPDANGIILGPHGPWNTLDIFTDKAAFVVHPPLGKWTIGLGEWLFGVTPFGWRFMVALLGTASVLMTARIIRRLTRSDVIGTLAGLLVAVDGLHIVMSRTALLDTVLMFWVLAGFGFLVLDRDAVRRKAAVVGWASGRGPSWGLRPWRLAAGCSLGLACGVKWSGLWFVAFFGLLTVWWDLQLRRQLGVRKAWSATLVRDAWPAVLSIVGLGFVAYLATWTGWLATDGGWDRAWAATHPGGLPFVPDALRSLLEYHRAAWQFNVGLESPHAYKSSAWSWPFMTRPTSFYYESPTGACGAERCSAAVLAVGNPLIWWAGVLAIGHNIWRAVAVRDWRSQALLVGYLAGWLPWMAFHSRTIFTFYAIVMVPFLAGMLAISLASLAGGTEASRDRRQWGLIAVGVFVVAVIAVTWFLLPVWTGQVITFEDWHMRMWLPSWV
jgi:dolichyl-phosphate-mannose-protein mannosyltransferase